MSSLDPKLAAIQQFLLCETPDAWVTTALNNQAVMLIDRALRKKSGLNSTHPALPLH